MWIPLFVNACFIQMGCRMAESRLYKWLFCFFECEERCEICVKDGLVVADNW